MQSNEAGIKSSFTKATLLNAAQTMFTANGLVCPVAVIESQNETYLINREVFNTLQ